MFRGLKTISKFIKIFAYLDIVLGCFLSVRTSYWFGILISVSMGLVLLAFAELILVIMTIEENTRKPITF